MPKDKEIKQLVELVPLEFDEYAKKYGSGENYLNYILHQIAMNLTRKLLKPKTCSGQAVYPATLLNTGVSNGMSRTSGIAGQPAVSVSWAGAGPISWL